MKNITLALGLAVLSVASIAGEGPSWSYSGEAGPDKWAKLTPEYATCAGKNQSPVNLSGFTKADLKPIKFSYKTDNDEILNNGHTIQVNLPAGSSIAVDGTQFDLKQFHFHAPSENLIDGKSYPLEAHLVHADKDGNLAVVAVMFKEGKANKALAKAWAQLPEKEGEKLNLTASLSATELLPVTRAYYSFSGSLTTPPCSEGVRWLVIKQPMTASQSQIEAFAHAVHHENNRPVQAINARAILK